MYKVYKVKKIDTKNSTSVSLNLKTANMYVIFF